jgi:hypothetical protein
VVDLHELLGDQPQHVGGGGPGGGVGGVGHDHDVVLGRDGVAAVKVIDPANSDLEKLAGTGPPPVD